MIKRALLRLESGFERLMVGRPQPTPKAIRDLGKTVAQAQNVQLVLEGMSEYRPFQHDVEDDNLGFDSEGNYHHPSLRTEHVDRNWDVT
jgi:hypothetical protein